MATNINWQDERGVVIAECPVWIDWEFEHPDMDIENTRCLGFIDDYGNTIFNQFQIPVLIQELESLLPNCRDEKIRTKLETLITFVRKAEGETHTYIKFIGD
jgi:hypothetical protein